jgi:hypothetical protein
MTVCECAHGRNMTSTHCIQLLCNDWQNYRLLFAGLAYCGHNRNEKYDMKERWSLLHCGSTYAYIMLCVPVYRSLGNTDPSRYPMVILNVKISIPKVANCTFRFCKALASPASFVNAPTHRRQRNRLHLPMTDEALERRAFNKVESSQQLQTSNHDKEIHEKLNNWSLIRGLHTPLFVIW